MIFSQTPSCELVNFTQGVASVQDVIDETELVIAHYTENLDWIKSVPPRLSIRIYSKGPSPPGNFTTLENIGRESQTYLHHIVHNYKNLPEWTVFSQGDPFEHSSNFLQLLAANPCSTSFESQNLFIPLGRLYNHMTYAVECLGDFEQRRYKSVIKLWNLIHPKLPAPRSLITVYGAIFAVHRAAIQYRSLSFYEYLLDLHKDMYVLPWALENLWPHIFMSDYYYKSCYLHL